MQLPSGFEEKLGQRVFLDRSLGRAHDENEWTAMKFFALCAAAAVVWTAGCSSSKTTGSNDAEEAADLPVEDGMGDAADDDDMGSDDQVEVTDSGDGEDCCPDIEIESVFDISDGDDIGEDEEDMAELPLEPLFTFAIMADSHVTGSGENADRLAAAVDWINDNAEERMIEVVLVLGDIGWGGGMDLSRGYLDELEVPYVPITGDNEVHAGDEELFEATFSDQYELLSTTFESWQRAAMPVWHPVADQDSWFTNMAFELHGVQFVGLDWAARGVEGLEGEMGDLHDFDGGTWQWFEGIFEALPKDAQESIVMFTHIPMHFGMFWGDEMSAIEALLGPYGDAVYADFAGHVHITYERTVAGGGYVVYATDAIFDDNNTLRLVLVEGNGARFVYTHELVVVE